MSEIETKRTTEADAEKATNKRADAVENHAEAEKKDESEVETSTLMPWDAHVDGFFARTSLYVRDLRLAMGHTEFRSLVVSYRELSAMGRRAVGTRLQQRGLNSLFRALHGGDYQMYQHTWQEDAQALERAGKLEGGG